MRQAILDILHHPALELDIDFERAADLLSIYLSELHKWNRKINLTSEKDEPSILTRHVFDSLQYRKVMGGGSHILDIGSGAGFPGIPLKIILPRAEFVLVESRRKRASFLGSAIRQLGLEKIQVFNERAEDLQNRETFAGRFDCVLFRAVSSALDCLTLGAPFINDTGSIIIKKEPGSPIISTDYESIAVNLKNSVPIVNHAGQKSELLVFGRCSA